MNPTIEYTQELEDEVLQDELKKDINIFIPWISRNYQEPIHLKAVTKELNKINNSDTSYKLAFAVPPRHGKSDTLLHYIAQYLWKNPHKKVAYVSYEQGFSEQQTQKSYAIMQRLKISQSGHTVNRKYWVMPEGGVLRTGSVQGPLTGQGYDLIIIDDPFKDAAEAQSRRIRDRIWMWYNDVAETRLEPGASIIVLHTRWHPDDLIGRITKEMKDEYTYIRIPAIADGMDAEGKTPMRDLNDREIGEPLWKERYNLDKLEKVKKYNPYGFSALYQGLPVTKEGRVFKNPTFYKELPNEIQLAGGIDLAYSKSTKADFSAAVILGRANDKIYVVDCERWQNDFVYTKQKLRQLQNKYNVAFRIEANGPQLAVYDELLNDGINVIKADVNNDKYTRSQPFAGVWNAGEVLLPMEAEWLREYIHEFTEFTGIDDRHDDMIDATVHAYEDVKYEYSNIWF